MIDEKTKQQLMHEGGIIYFRKRFAELEEDLMTSFIVAKKRVHAHCNVMLKLDLDNPSHQRSIETMEKEIRDVCVTTSEMIEFFQSYDLHV